MRHPYVLIGILVMLTTSPAGAQPCLRGLAESAEEQNRRDAGVRYLAAINAAQARTQKETGKYAPLSELPGLPPTPIGFIPKLLFDQWSYLISLKDYFDPCGLALFSDERGIVYEGQPRALVLPDKTADREERERSGPESPRRASSVTSGVSRKD